MPIERRAGLPVDASWENCPFSMGGSISNKVGALGYPVKGGTFQVETIAAKLGTTPATGNVRVDVNKNGTSIYGTQGNRPDMANGATNGIATVSTHTATMVTDGDWITVDVEGTYTGSPADLVVVVRMRRIA